MTLLDAQPEKPKGVLRRYLVLWILLAVGSGAILFILFRNYSEERAVSRFLAALQQGQYREAYELWQPGPSYTYEDFLGGWGEKGDYGKIREFEILGSRSKGSNTVIVVVRINRGQPTEILVDRKTKGLAYSVF
ncbi:MAG: hypothetical protein HY508_04675 [Acidobacteria bacterium]|nr:hypothetical protein [Acidobacteriota bacterium]